MIQVPRDDRSVIGQWWWTVDRWALGAVLAIMAFGVMLTLAASPPAAERIGVDSFMFAKRQFIFLPLALALMLAISLASPRHVRRLALLVWGYAIVSFLIASAIKVGIYRQMEHRAARQARYLARIEGPLSGRSPYRA